MRCIPAIPLLVSQHVAGLDAMRNLVDQIVREKTGRGLV
jgi:hypothetical protein